MDLYFFLFSLFFPHTNWLISWNAFNWQVPCFDVISHICTIPVSQWSSQATFSWESHLKAYVGHLMNSSTQRNLFYFTSSMVTKYNWPYSALVCVSYLSFRLLFAFKLLPNFKQTSKICYLINLMQCNEWSTVMDLVCQIIHAWAPGNYCLTYYRW